MFGQTFAPGDLATIALLVVLEGLLSIDNALVLGVLAQRLDPSLRVKALSYGLIVGLVLRLLAIAAAALLLRFSIIKLIGGTYLLWISIHYFFFPKSSHTQESAPVAAKGSLWPTVAMIELTDLAFAVDSVLAAVALVGPAPASSTSSIHPKFWVIATGGLLGIVMMRFAAAAFARLLEKFPRLHLSAYLLVLLIGAKLVIDWAINSPSHPNRVDFQDPSRIELWIFWVAVVVCLSAGLKPRRENAV